MNWSHSQYQRFSFDSFEGRQCFVTWWFLSELQAYAVLEHWIINEADKQRRIFNRLIHSDLYYCYYDDTQSGSVGSITR